MDRFFPIGEIAFGSAMLILSLIIHGFGMLIVQRSNRHFQELALGFRREAAFSLLILMLLLTHMVEMLMWASMLTWGGAIATFRNSYYYVAVTYTTLGYGEGTLSEPWRIMAPMMAMSGVFAFGWTTSVLFSIVAPPQKPSSPVEQ